MSFFTQASFVMDPNVYGVGKLYVPKPTDGSGDLTFTRASNGTRVNADGLVEKVRTNYCRYSQDFGSWSKFGSVTRTTGVTDPNGGTTAATISNIPSGNFTDGIMLANNPMTIGSEPIVGSVWLKGSGTIGLALERSVSGDYFFYQKLVTLTSTWTRYTIRGSSAGSRAGFTFYIANKTDSTATSVDVAFAQTEYGDIETDYIATTSAAVSVGPLANIPRLNYGADGCPSLLLEPQRTNIVRFSEQFDNAAWTKINATITANALTSPDGYANADLITTSSAGLNIYQSVSVTAGQTHTASVFVKAGTLTQFSFGFSDNAIDEGKADFNLTTLTATPVSSASWTNQSASIQNYGNGWYRCIYTGTNTSASTNFIVLLRTFAAGTLYAYGIQHEASASYATSYIPTLSSAVTRVADVAYKTGMTSAIGQTEGTIFIEFFYNEQNKIPSGSDKSVCRLKTGGGYTDEICITYYGDEGSSYGKTIQTFITVGGAPQAYLKTTQTMVSGYYKVAVAYKANDFAMAVNGAIVSTANSGSVPTCADLTFNESTRIQSDSSPKQAILFKTRLSNADLARLTSL